MKKVPSLKKLNEMFGLTGLEEEISRRAGYHIPIKGKVYRSRAGSPPRIEFSSGDLVGHGGLLSQVHKSFKIGDFGSNISCYEFDEEPGIMLWGWVGVNFRWEYKSGGSNGTDWFNSWYNFETKKWRFSPMDKHTSTE